MSISQKCQYAVRAVFELTKRGRGTSATINEIAEAQAIPVRFLEVILAQLRQGGFVESRRGVQGGYRLAMDPRTLTAADVIQFIDGPIDPVRCTIGEAEADCRLYGQCVFLGLWKRARDAVVQVYKDATFQKLVEEERESAEKFVSNYCI
jgi:Rrf2 family transcriptional regulator, cysteine metabolism repressor